MKKQYLRIGAALCATVFITTSASAAITGIDSVNYDVAPAPGGVGDAYNLVDITVGSYTIGVADLAFGLSSGEVNDFGAPNYMIAADDTDINSIFGRNNDIDPKWVIRSFGMKRTIANGNGSAPDFFIFEAGGNDSFDIRAVLANGSYGEWVTVDKSLYGPKLATKTGNYNDLNNNQAIKGIALDFTDLGVAPDAELQGIDISSLTIDGAAVLASTVVPEPSALSLLGLGFGGLFMAIRRKR